MRVGTFTIDATPPEGSPLCDGLVGPVKSVDDPLTARGIVIVGAESNATSTSGKPIVLVALDWVGIGNSGYDRFRAEIAAAVGTVPERVAIHALHQHDAPGCDFEAEEILVAHGLGGAMFNVAHARQQIMATAAAAKKALAEAKPVTHMGHGQAKIVEVASARRVIGPDGKVLFTRTSATKNPEARAMPEGVIDPYVQMLSFWNGNEPLVVASYYATHPMAHYGAGRVSADFIGLGRNAQEKASGVPQVHFNGAGGNVTAGKYNDGDAKNRGLLAERTARGMAEAWAATKKTAITSADVVWRVENVVLPVSPRYVDEAVLLEKLADDKALKVGQRVQYARHIAFARRAKANHPTPLQLLKVGPAYVLHMPGELFVEYQLAAQEMRKGAPVMMAAYGDYGAGYIGMKWSYPQGGYETGAVSRVAPEVEDVLMPAMRRLLGAEKE
ncbi:MAG: hypothetical protein K8U03_12840 [Planctomycetia bacterium]|nr:hypothetical protein [Planctomycetia bacterium]